MLFKVTLEMIFELNPELCAVTKNGGSSGGGRPGSRVSLNCFCGTSATVVNAKFRGVLTVKHNSFFPYS